MDTDESMTEEEDLDEVLHGGCTGDARFAWDFDSVLGCFLSLDGPFLHLGWVVGFWGRWVWCWRWWLRWYRGGGGRGGGDRRGRHGGWKSGGFRW